MGRASTGSEASAQLLEDSIPRLGLGQGANGAFAAGHGLGVSCRTGTLITWPLLGTRELERKPLHPQRPPKAAPPGTG